MLRGDTAKVTSNPHGQPPGRPRQHQNHLSTKRQHELVDRYKAGATQRELAEEYRIHRRTVANILDRHGAARNRGLLPELVEEAAQRYAEGQSLAAIGQALGADAGTVRARLLERGVVMRSTAGGAR